MKFKNNEYKVGGTPQGVTALGHPAAGTAGCYLPLSWRCCSSWMTSAMPSSGTCRRGGDTESGGQLPRPRGHPCQGGGSPGRGGGAHQSVVEVEGADVIGRDIGGGQRLGDLRHDAALVWGGEGTPPPPRVSVTPQPRHPPHTHTAPGRGKGARPPRRPRSPKPRGCPPMRTIRQSSPVELVSSRSLGKLSEGARLSVTPPAPLPSPPGPAGGQTGGRTAPTASGFRRPSRWRCSPR